MKLFYLLPSIFYILITAVAASAQSILPPGAPNPEVMIIEPVAGAELPTGQDVMLTFGIDNFLFVDFKNNSEPFPGNPSAGHAHVWVDDVSYDHNTGRKLLSTDPVNLGMLEKGKHVVVLELTGNDHSAYNPPARTAAEFYVGEKPLVSLGFGSIGGVGGLMFILLSLVAAGGFVYWFVKRGGDAKFRMLFRK